MTQEPYMYGGQMNFSISSGHFNDQYELSPPDINQSLTNFPPPIILPDHELALHDLDYAQQVLMVVNQQQLQQRQNETSNFGSGSVCSSSYLSSPSSLASYNCCSSSSCSSSMHRSESNHSFPKSGFNPFASASVSSPTGLPSDSDDPQLQGVRVPSMQNYRAGSPLLSPKESSLAVIEGMSKAQRYTAEEKKERIERYKSKRNQRNFNKKIQYACRKTLADSRPRIKGRFARNDDPDDIFQNPWSHTTGGDNEDDHQLYVEDISWINLLNNFSSN